MGSNPQDPKARARRKAADRAKRYRQRKRADSEKPERKQAKRAKRAAAQPEPEPPPAKRPTGRPRLEFDLKEVEALGALHVTNAEAAVVLGCSEDTVAERRANDPEFRAAFERGQMNRRASLRRRQMQLADQGDRTMLIWLGKQFLGQSDKHRAELDASVKGGVLVIPGRVSDQEWLERYGRPRPDSGHAASG